MSQDYNFLKKLVKNRKIPLVVCDFDVFKQNLEKAGTLLMKKNKSLRLCTKSVRVPELVKFVESQKFVNGIFTFNSAEVLFYAKEYNIKDILLGYPMYSNIDASELCKAAKVEGVSVSVMVDDVKQVQLLETHANENNVHLNLLIEIDVSYRFISQIIGVLRSPLKQIDEILHLAQIIEDADTLSLRGIMGYEAQNASLGDNKLLYRYVKGKSRKYVNTMRDDIVNNLIDAGHSLEVVNGGGSGCFQENLEEPSITEIGIGSLLFKPHIFDTINSLDEFNPSLFFVLQVVRKPQKNIITTFSGGYVSSGAVRSPPKPVVPEGLKTLKFEGFGEVQTPFKYNPKKIGLDLGDPIFCRFAKAGEPLEHFNEVHLYSKGEIIDTYKTYRGLGKRFS